MRKKAFLFSAGVYLKSKTLSINDLSGVKYDILAMGKRLSQIGFEITKIEDANKTKYIPTIEKGVERLPDDAISIVYFSGHGGHCNGKNYIFPSDFGTQYDISRNIDDAGINIEDIISLFKGKGRLIIILDACRSDDIGLSRGHYSEITFSENVYIAYGTMFQKSSTGIHNGLSWFTEAICDEILTPNIDVDTLFTQVRQNIFTKHYVQIPPSVNALLDKIVLHKELSYDDTDKMVYDFIQKYGDEYTDKFGYFHGDDLIFIDAAQYFDIGLLDAIWKFRKVDNKIYKDKGINVPELPEAESKLVTFLGFTRSPKFFTCDESHTWYYNGRQIRMGEIPPLPPSMQRKLPEVGKEFWVEFKIARQGQCIVIKTNLPDGCEIFIWNNKTKFNQKMVICNSAINIDDAEGVNKVVIDSGVFTSDPVKQQIIGDKGRNLIGEFIKYHPIYGNQLKVTFEI